MGRNTNFYYSFLVLSPERRRAIVAVWDFCRAVDDAVDEATDAASAASALERWRADLARCFDGAAPTTSEGRALQPWIARFSLPRRPFEDVIDGVEMDLRVARYGTFADLEPYCRRVASAVGLICVEIFGYSNAATRDFAIDLGMALQLTNIVRDLGADVRNGRLYLPLEDLERFGCTEDDLRSGAMTDRTTALLRFECERAHAFYRSAAAKLPREDARRLVAAKIMGAIYFAILRRIERAHYNVFVGETRVPRWRKAFIAASTWATTMVLGR